MNSVYVKTALVITMVCSCVEAHAQSRLLKQFDTDGDGQISTEERAAIVDKFDKEKDGALSKSEVGDRFWSFLGRMDANGDGKVTPAEARQQSGAGAKPASGSPNTESAMLSKFRQLDRNNDQAVSREEAADRWVRLGRLDANGDDKVTLDEARKALSAAGGQPRKSSPSKGPDGFDDKHIYKEASGAELPLYVYNPPGHSAGARVPAIVFFHGGGWKGGAPSAFERQCQHLSKRGMVAITVEYRLTSNYPIKIDDCVEDAKSAMRWVRGNAGKLGIDPSRIASGGGSAGGHLAACTAVVDTHNARSDNQEVSAKPNAMILFNPGLMLAANDRFTNDQKALVEKRMKDQTRGEPEQISPLAHARKKQPPCIMFFGTADKLLGPAQWYLEDSVAAGNECEMKTYEGEEHGFWNRGEPFVDTLRRSDRFLVKLGWLPQADQ